MHTGLQKQQQQQQQHLSRSQQSSEQQSIAQKPQLKRPVTLIKPILISSSTVSSPAGSCTESTFAAKPQTMNKIKPSVQPKPLGLVGRDTIPLQHQQLPPSEPQIAATKTISSDMSEFPLPPPVPTQPPLETFHNHYHQQRHHNAHPNVMVLSDYQQPSISSSLRTNVESSITQKSTTSLFDYYLMTYFQNLMINRRFNEYCIIK